MKRLIKFRGKRTDTGEWVYGNLLTTSNGYGFIDTNNELYEDESYIFRDNTDMIRVAVSKVSESTVGQFTGLLDKNGKEIYEGDILATNGRLIGYVVGGVRGYCYDVVYTPALKNGETSWSLYGVVVNDHPNEVEVIGNVFDNLNLLQDDTTKKKENHTDK